MSDNNPQLGPPDYLEIRSQGDLKCDNLPEISDMYKNKILVNQRKLLVQQNAIQAAHLAINKAQSELTKIEIEFAGILNEIVTTYKIDTTKTSINLESLKLVPKATN
jgi:hypothetical protein